ncbi:MAG: hypothetical protein COV67_04255 [Nitrospinae bacterium CG11_big_fil_rev_8_21_14_0_20_56_8]|nr:MAG: hypothetical protein COV67_04255 [Nitrospinae bacterium CG11_big_fil_rev_8_21_14_0_20_56_8]
MKETLLGKARKKTEEEGDHRRGEGFCSVCHRALPPKSLFCPNCGLPEPPEEDPERGLTFGQALLRILGFVLLFCALVVYKLDIQLEQFVPGPGKVPDKIEYPKTTDPDFKVIHIVNMAMVNVREGPSMDAKVVTVLEKGTHVKVLKTKGDWSQIEGNGVQAWVVSRLLTAHVK